MSNPISLCLIVRNDDNIKHCIASIRQFVNEVVIVDTGSTKENQDEYRKLADVFEVFTKCNNKKSGLIEDFSKARNKSFALATNDWVIWADSDDIIEGGENLKNILSQYKSPVSIMFPYEYAYNENHKSILTQYRERLFYKKDNFFWCSPVHENCIALNGEPNVKRNELVFKHQRQYLNKPQERGRNLRILKKYFNKVGEKDKRQLFYLAQEEYDNGLFADAKKHYCRYVEINNWPDEAFMACLRLIAISRINGDKKEAMKWAFEAISIQPNWCEGYFEVGKLFYEKNDWKNCVNFIQMGFSHPETETTLFINKTERAFDVHRYYNFALNNCGRVSEAYQSCKTALLERRDDALEKNARIYEDYLFQKQEKKVNLKGKLDIVFALGDGLEVWNSQTVKTSGIGGSEMMAINMTERLAALGHNVTIYNSCGAKTILNNVVYEQTEAMHDIKCDVFIASRYANFMDESLNIEAKLNLLWCHDVCIVNAKEKYLKRIDKVICLSQWHKQNLIKEHSLREDKIIVSRNGIDLKRFDKKVEKIPFRCINSSSPERSWLMLLDCWPSIREAHPEAELHLFYGFDNFNLWKTTRKELYDGLQSAIEKTKDMGVSYHGRVSQEVLAEEFLLAEYWLYPCSFLETSCITAMEAMAAGCKIITTDLAALTETVSNYGILLPASVSKEVFIEETLKLMASSYCVLPDVERFNLDSLVREWENMLYSL